MKKLLLNPFLAPLCVIVYVALFFGVQFNAGADAIFHFTDTTLDTITYAIYALTAVVVVWAARDFKGAQFNHFILFVFLFICALLREMGVQHWLTKTDTTAFKLPFFTNPNNPLHEKLVAGYILLVVAAVVLYLLAHYLPFLIKSFFQFNPIAWTVCTLGGTGIVCKIADRFPSNYKKMMEMPMDPSVHAYIELFEETTESALPLLFALALIQYHFSQKKSIQKPQ